MIAQVKNNISPEEEVLVEEEVAEDQIQTISAITVVHMTICPMIALKNSLLILAISANKKDIKASNALKLMEVEIQEEEIREEEAEEAEEVLEEE